MKISKSSSSTLAPAEGYFSLEMLCGCAVDASFACSYFSASLALTPILKAIMSPWSSWEC